MRWTALTVLAAAAAVVVTALPADAQSRRKRIDAEAYPGAGYSYNRAPTRITVRRARTYLVPGTEVLPLSQQYTDYALPPLWYPSKNWDAAGSWRYPLPDNFNLPGYVR